VTTITTATTTSSSTTATTWTSSSRSSFVDTDSSAHDVLTVQFSDGNVSVTRVLECNETESLRSSGVTIDDNSDINDRAILPKRRAEIIFTALHMDQLDKKIRDSIFSFINGIK